MTGFEFLRMIHDGIRPVVEFRPGIDEQESCIDPGMRGRAVSAALDKDGLIVVQFDLEPFVEFNKPLARRDYYGPDGKASLTAWEAGYYRPIEEIWMDRDTNADAFFKIVSAGSLALHEEYKRSAEPGTSFLEWLEAELLAARSSRELGAVGVRLLRAWRMRRSFE